MFGPLCILVVGYNDKKKGVALADHEFDVAAENIFSKSNLQLPGNSSDYLLS